jgi:hypothetical protein
LRNARDVLAWLVEICDEAELDRIKTGLEDDRNSCFRGLRGERGRRAGCGNHGRLVLHKIGHQGRQPVGMVVRPTVFDLHVAAIGVAGFGEPVEKGRKLALVILGRLRVQKSDDRDDGLLRLRYQRP